MTEQFTLGPGILIYRGEYLGLYDAAPLLSIDCELLDIPNAVTLQTEDYILQGMKMTLRVEVAMVRKALEVILQGESGLGTAQLNRSLRAKAGELRLIPLDPAAVGIRFPLAALNLNFQYSLAVTGNHSIALNFIAFPGESGRIFEPHVATAADRDMIPPLIELKLVELEQKVADFLVGRLGLAIDRTVFRGAVPLKKSGCGIALEQLLHHPEQGDFIYSIKLAFQGDTRDEVLRLMARLSSQLPLYRAKLDETLTAALMQLLELHFPEARVEDDDTGYVGSAILRLVM